MHYRKPLLVQCALTSLKSKKKPYLYHKYKTLKKHHVHKKAIIANARKMLVLIYHIIMNDKDFLPVDYEHLVVQKQKSNGLDLEKVIAFLEKQGRWQCDPSG